MVLIYATVVQSASAGPPIIESQWVTGVSASNATLNAQINPSGLLTKYKLQIDTTGNFKFFQTDGCPLHPPGVGCAQVIIPGEPQPAGLVQPPEMTLSGSTLSQFTTVNLSSIGAVLQAETTYHFRAIAANGANVVHGADLTFTTPPLGAPTFSEPKPPVEEVAPEEPEVQPPSSQKRGESSYPPIETDETQLIPSANGGALVSSLAQQPVARRKKHRKQQRRGISVVHQARPLR